MSDYSLTSQAKQLHRCVRMLNELEEEDAVRLLQKFRSQLLALPYETLAYAFDEARGPRTYEAVQELLRASLSSNSAVLKQYAFTRDTTREERQSDPMLRVREFNNRAKSFLINRVIGPFKVLDLACGKGGDLFKWRGVKEYVGIDISEESIALAKERYMQSRLTFQAEFHVGDAFGDIVETIIGGDRRFDIVSCMFALHYAFRDERTARRAVRNIAASLRKGGRFIAIFPDPKVIERRLKGGMKFGNQLYQVTLAPLDTEGFGVEYHFFLKGLIDCPEYLVYDLDGLMHREATRLVRRPLAVGEMANEYLKLEMEQNLSEVGGYGRLNPSEREVASLYKMVEYVKE